MAYTTTMWLSFGETLAAISGALTGLLFVAVSVKGTVLTGSRSLSSRRKPWHTCSPTIRVSGGCLRKTSSRTSRAE